jgi:hypothetical protein
MDPYLLNILQQLGISEEIRNDAAYTANLSRQLEYVQAKTYDTLYAETKIRRFLPVNREVPAGAETFTYRQWTSYGIAKIIANYADDLPSVDALAEEFPAAIKSLGDSYQYSVQDIAAAAMSGNQLDSRRASAARRGMEFAVDQIGSVGDAKAKLPGFLNNANVTVLSATSDGTSARWLAGNRGTGVPAKSPDLILADMYAATTQILTASKELFMPDTVLLPTAEFAHISQTKVGADNRDTILTTFKANSMSVKMVESWHKLATADAAGTGPRMVTYAKNPDVVELVIPQEFTQLPSQAKNLAFQIPCHMRIGGVVVRYPLAIVYTDGI